MRSPAGDAGLSWSHAVRGQRPTPQSTNPDQYTPAGWAEACDRAATDPKVAAGLEVRSATLINADVRAVPGRDTSPEMAAAVALVNECFGWDGAGPGYLERGWQQVFGELMCRADTHGASLGEERWELINGRRVLVDIEQRHLANLEGWQRDERGRVVGAHMRTSSPARRTYIIPLYGLADEFGGGVHFSFGFDGDPEGRLASILGATVDYVALKRHMDKQAWDGVSRWAMPVVKAKLMAEVASRMGMTLDDSTIAELVNRTAASATAFLAGEEAAFSSSDIIDLEPFGGVLDLEQWVKLCNAVDHQVLTVLGVPTLTMGVSAAHGSRSAAESIGDLFLRTVAARLTLWLAQFRRQSVARLVRANLGPDAPIPLIIHEGLDVDGLGVNLGNLPSLVNSKILWKDNGFRRALRRTLGLPPEGPDAAPVQPGDVIGQYYPTDKTFEQTPGPGRGNDFMPNGQPADGGAVAPEAAD